MRFLFVLVSCLLAYIPIFGKNNSRVYKASKGNFNQSLFVLHKTTPTNIGRTHNAHSSHMAHASHASHFSSQHTSHTSHFSSAIDNYAKVEVKGEREINNVDLKKLKRIVSEGSGLSCKNIRIQYCYLKAFQNVRVEQKCYIITIDFGSNVYKYYIYGKMKYFFLLQNGFSVYDTPQKISDIIWLERIVKILQK